MSVSKYGQEAGSERDIGITIGQSHVQFTIEPVKTKREERRERLRLAFGMARDRENAKQFWQDNDQTRLRIS